MVSTTLSAYLARLTRPTEASFSVVEAGFSPRVYAAVDAQGRPALLVETSATTSREVVRRGLRLQHRATCHVELGGSVRTVTASVVACESDDPGLQEAFVSVGEIVLSRLSTARESQVVAILEELVELLERPGEPSREGAIGLFAELLVLSLARDPVSAVRAWRVGAADRYDFVVGSDRIEVKASGSRERRHSFSLEQCVPDPGSRAFVASTLVLESSGGVGVRDLSTRIKNVVRTEAELTMKIERAVLSVMGLPRNGEPLFDEAHAVTKLRWYSVEDIPAVRDVPENVDQVRFRTNLDNVRPLTSSELEVRAKEISACIPPFGD